MEEHGLKCISCESSNIRLTSRQWAVCMDCQKGMGQGEAILCTEWCEVCLSAAS